jgi:Inner membrane protein YgaP-like, transmembrane domain
MNAPSHSAVSAPRREFSLERGVAAFAGFMVLLSVALTYWVHPGFVWLTVFVGANLLQQSFTGFCPAAMVMHRLGLKTEAEISGAAR